MSFQSPLIEKSTRDARIGGIAYVNRDHWHRITEPCLYMPNPATGKAAAEAIFRLELPQQNHDRLHILIGRQPTVRYRIASEQSRSLRHAAFLPAAAHGGDGENGDDYGRNFATAHRLGTLDPGAIKYKRFARESTSNNRGMFSASNMPRPDRVTPSKCQDRVRPLFGRKLK